jgi:hypothetical protein
MSDELIQEFDDAFMRGDAQITMTVLPDQAGEWAIIGKAGCLVLLKNGRTGVIRRLVGSMTDPVRLIVQTMDGELVNVGKDEVPWAVAFDDGGQGAAARAA